MDSGAGVAASGAAGQGDEVLLDVQRNKRERLRVTRNKYSGRTFVHVRLYYEADDGAYKPGNKGIALREDELDAVVAAIQAAKRALQPTR
ncbi:transcriptional coactivator p15/PC4 family protein [Sorangium sp. So ce216]